MSNSIELSQKGSQVVRKICLTILGASKNKMTEFFLKRFFSFLPVTTQELVQLNILSKKYRIGLSNLNLFLSLFFF
jgi:hypothetical protein